MRFVFIWIILSFMVSLIARRKGLSVLGYFWLSMALTPFIGFILVWMATPHPHLNRRPVNSTALRQCPNCKKSVSVGTLECRFCGRPLPEVIDVEGKVENT